jgi:hypothetical protein
MRSVIALAFVALAVVLGTLVHLVSTLPLRGL